MNFPVFFQKRFDILNQVCYNDPPGVKNVADEIKINDNSVFCLKPNIALKQEPDFWGILYNPETQYSFGINPLSVSIVKLLQGQPGARVSNLVECLKPLFPGSITSLTEDVAKFLERLLELEMLVLIGAGDEKNE